MRSRSCRSSSCSSFHGGWDYSGAPTVGPEIASDPGRVTRSEPAIGVGSRMVQAVIFDIDGTLIDSVDLHAKAWQEAFRHFGHDLPFERIRAQIGKGGDQLLPALL